MKKILTCLILVLIVLCTGINVNAKGKEKWSSSSSLKKYENVDTEFRAVWVCTVGNMDVKKQEGTSEAAIQEWKEQYLTILDNAQAHNLNTIIFQIRPCNDAFYPSKYNPWSEYLCAYGKDPGWDPLEWMLEVTHERGMEYHAWMNPYRVTTSAVEKIVKNTGGSVENVYDYDNEALQVAKQKVFGDRKSKALANGMKDVDNPVFYEGEDLEYNVVLGTEAKYVLNPASEKTITHLENTIREVVENYDIDGIHFDDYFYPNDCSYISTGTNDAFKGLTFSTESITDYADYQKYLKNGGSLSIYDWRRENINTLIKNLSEIIREVNKTKDIPCAFGISPAGRWAPAPEACPAGSPRPTEGGMQGSCGNYYSYSDLFADTKKWVDEEWIDYLLPQVYSELGGGYDEVIDWWSKEMKDSPVKLYAGTALYQIDTWGDTLEIYYQVRYNQSIGNRVDGYSMFRYVNLLNGKSKTAISTVSKSLWKTNALTPLYEGYNYKHEVSKLAEINKIVEGSNNTRRMYYQEVEDAKAYILYRTTDKLPSELKSTDILVMNLKNKGYFDIEYNENYKYYLATVSQDNTIYLDETEISFANTEMNQAPIVTLNSSFYKTVLIESKVHVEFKIEDPEGKELKYQTYIVENGNESVVASTIVDGIVKIEWEAPFVDVEDLKFKIVVSDSVKETIFETETFDVIEKCNHEYEEATCENPSQCSLCGKIIKKELGHSWSYATCKAPKTCSVCGKTEGENGDHMWVDATCTKAAHCSVCGLEEGTPLEHTKVVDKGYAATCEKEGLTDGSHCSVCNKVLEEQKEIKKADHTWVDATKKAPKTCSVCGETTGEKLKGCKKSSVVTILSMVSLLATSVVLLRKKK